MVLLVLLMEMFLHCTDALVGGVQCRPDFSETQKYVGGVHGHDIEH